jgi:endonuclease YncB( thermonuclease family)
MPAYLYPSRVQASLIVIYLEKDRKISLNQEIVAQGLATVDKMRVSGFEAELFKKLEEAEDFARKNRVSSYWSRIDCLIYYKT